jgi:hypothetical protein
MSSIKKCDLCGESFTEKSHPVYDENFNKQKGLIQCDACLSTATGITELEPMPGKYKTDNRSDKINSKQDQAQA